MTAVQSEVSETEAVVTAGLALSETREALDHLAAEGEVACREDEGVRRWWLC